MDDYEYAVFHRAIPNEPHRGPMTEQAAHEWIAEWIDDGGKHDTFYVMRRRINPWEDA
jgi:hypothetical protein